ncbi:hypothetical protein CLV30_10855 [Haloactinopolyspora alba]|uniref:DprA winged helix domain-containing protein n=1 Tax=Haloactinopolyspora alba TaxID=648780 RepID=A0A2P8E0Z7_9ACTN|nr:hypothetical protein [Haloactinopolyspora alba]PSL03143.1 hypothetical protein CLV30_10855 [Haloactinopolyspora alba]
MTATTDGQHPVFGPVLSELNERHRDEVLTAFAAVEHGRDPVPEAQLAALRDATLRRHLRRLLDRVGRTLVQVGNGHWTSGYADDVAARLSAEGWQPLPAIDRAVLVLVLVHSVAIPRSQGLLSGDSWTSAHPTSADELVRYAQLPRGEIRPALQRLRAAGLVQSAPWRGRGPDTGTAYLPGPALNRLTPSARQRLEHQLILAAAPESPLAASIRAKQAASEHTDGDR